MNQDLSIVTLVLHASAVVQVVMAGLMLASLSSWTAVLPIGATAQKGVVIPPVSVTMKQTRSAPLITRLALSRE